MIRAIALVALSILAVAAAAACGYWMTKGNYGSTAFFGIGAAALTLTVAHIIKSEI